MNAQEALILMTKASLYDRFIVPNAEVAIAYAEALEWFNLHEAMEGLRLLVRQYEQFSLPVLIRLMNERRAAAFSNGEDMSPFGVDLVLTDEELAVVCIQSGFTGRVMSAQGRDFWHHRAQLAIDGGVIIHTKEIVMKHFAEGIA